MRLHTCALALALAGVALGSVACGSSIKQGMLELAPPGYDVQLISIRVMDTEYGRLTVDESLVDLLRRREGVIDVKRGPGRELLYVLAEAHVDPYSLTVTARERFSVRILEVEKNEPRRVPAK